MKEKILEILNENSTVLFSKGSCGELGDSENAILSDDFEIVADKIYSINSVNYLLELINKLQNKELHFRIEDDEEMVYLSIVDRSVYPRIWADNIKSNDFKISSESTEHLIERSISGSEKDWIYRCSGNTIEECVKQCNHWLKNHKIQAHFL